MDRWQREVAQIFYGEPDASRPAVTHNSTWTPPVDLREEDTRFVLRADVPGVALKDIEVTAEDGTLTIRGERRAREDAKSDGFEHIECFTGTFLRRLHCRNLHKLRGSRRAAPMVCSRLRSPNSLVSRPSVLR